MRKQILLLVLIASLLLAFMPSTRAVSTITIDSFGNTFFLNPSVSPANLVNLGTIGYNTGSQANYLIVFLSMNGNGANTHCSTNTPPIQYGGISMSVLVDRFSAGCFTNGNKHNSIVMGLANPPTGSHSFTGVSWNVNGVASDSLVDAIFTVVSLIGVQSYEGSNNTGYMNSAATSDSLTYTPTHSGDFFLNFAQATGSINNLQSVSGQTTLLAQSASSIDTNYGFTNNDGLFSGHSFGWTWNSGGLTRIEYSIVLVPSGSSGGTGNNGGTPTGAFEGLLTTIPSLIIILLFVGICYKLVPNEYGVLLGVSVGVMIMVGTNLLGLWAVVVLGIIWIAVLVGKR